MSTRTAVTGEDPDEVAAEYVAVRLTERRDLIYGLADARTVEYAAAAVQMVLAEREMAVLRAEWALAHVLAKGRGVNLRERITDCVPAALLEAAEIAFWGGPDPSVDVLSGRALAPKAPRGPRIDPPW